MSEQKKEDGEEEGWSINYDRYFLMFLEKYKKNIGLCCYQTGEVLTLGITYNKERKQNVLSLWIENHSRPMSLTYNNKNLYIGTRNQIIQYRDEGKSDTDNEIFNDFDRTFVERRSNNMNDIDIHDLRVGNNDKVYFISSLFSCIGTRSDTNSFKVYWKPPWVSKIVSENRCHLNGMCCVDGVPKYVTSISRTDSHNGWKNHREKGGVVYDIVNNKLLCKNLCMPHSPIFYNDKLWILESGKGQFGYIDFTKTEEDEGEIYHPFVPLIFIPGFIRGISFINSTYAVVGSSHDRHEQMFSGLPLEGILKDKEIESNCGIFIINIKTNSIAHSLVFEKRIKEIYDVLCIDDCVRGKISNVHITDSIEYNIDYNIE